MKEATDEHGSIRTTHNSLCIMVILPVFAVANTGNIRVSSVPICGKNS